MKKKEIATPTKPNYRSTYLVNYFTCPKKYILSTEHKIETNDVMRDGLLFEGYVFDRFKENNEDELIGRKKPATIEAIKTKADYVRKLFVKGEPFVKLNYSCEDYTITGEADYIGNVVVNGEQVRCIADLKFTGNLKIWDDKLSEMKRENFIQAYLYPYLWYQMKEEILPFVYIIVENTFETPLIKIIRFNPSFQDFGYIVDVVEKVNADNVYVANQGYGTCVNGKWGRCDMLQYCQEGREFIAEPVEMDLSFLS